MTIRQTLLNTFYPIIMKLAGWKAKKYSNTSASTPIAPFHSLHAVLPKGHFIHFEAVKGKKIMIVNTASDCGFTAQYAELQQLHESHGHLLTILAFPSNEFGEQEKGTDEQIIQFCKDNFGVSFPVAVKSSVRKGPQQNPVYQWLSQPEKNGWNEQAPSWNFCKYIIDEKGVLTHFFDSSVSPLGKEVKAAIEQG
jgi:glutathione peroxidase